MSEIELSEWQDKALRYIGKLNAENLGAIMPYGELITAAEELNKLGLSEDRGGTARRWLTDAGKSALSKALGANLTP